MENAGELVKEYYKVLKVCPTKFAIKIFKKWSIEIIRDIWFSERRFSEILKANPGLSTKVLSQRLKELEQHEIIEKVITSKTPLQVVYQLTEKGQALNKILFDLAIFSYDYYAKEILNINTIPRLEMIKKTAKIFKINSVSNF